MGARPGVSDFALLRPVEPACAFRSDARRNRGRTRRRAWSHGFRIIDDLSSLDVEMFANGLRARTLASKYLRPFFIEIGRVYAPFLIANARALSDTCASEVRMRD